MGGDFGLGSIEAKGFEYRRIYTCWHLLLGLMVFPALVVMRFGWLRCEMGRRRVNGEAMQG